MRLAVYATLTVLLLEYINGMPHLRGSPLGGSKLADFLKYRGVNRQGTRRRRNGYPPVVQVALGAASALSPCVVPPLAVGVLGGRRIKRYFAGLHLGYAAWAKPWRLPAPPRRWGSGQHRCFAMFFSLYLIHERLPPWRIQTLGGRLSRKGPLVAGF
jgi:hypothetical protein